MKKMLLWMLCLMLLLCSSALTEQTEVLIVLSDDTITVDGEAISSHNTSAVYLDSKIETHEDVPKDLKELANRVVTITKGGSYRVTGAATDAQIVVRAGETDRVRLILDGIDLSCRTSSAIIGEKAYDPRTPGEYGLTIELAENSVNKVTGSHTKKLTDADIEYDGAIDSLVSIGFEGSGKLIVDADNEGIEALYGHMTINGGVFEVSSGDDPLNVSEDGVGTLTVNDGYLYSAVKPSQGGEGDGIDSNGYIIFNGGTIINLAHPSSGDSGIDSDMGSSINGGVVVGAGNMYDPIEESSDQLFMMLEFGQATDDLVVVTDAADKPVFAYDFPHSYTYIAFSTPELSEGIFHVYLGGEIEGEQSNGLYTSITSYVPGTLMQHGGGTAQRAGIPGMSGQQPPEMPEEIQNFGKMQKEWEKIDLNEILKDTDLDELLKGKDLNQLLSGFSITDLLTEDQIKEHLGDVDPQIFSMFGGMGRGGRGGGFGGPRSLESSAEIATADFALSKTSTGFTAIVEAE
ncbi:MAG: carbohydrate-binding domain-containing protein [Clostridia bacterium]|nr:carbohydrate-binding domain-containing protein [Clostridia bacterium]